MSENYYYPAGRVLKELYLNKNDEAAAKAILAELRSQAGNRTVAVPKRTAHASGTLATLFQGEGIVVLSDAEYARLNTEAFEARKAARLEREARNRPTEKTDATAMDTGPAHADKAIGRKKKNGGGHERRHDTEEGRRRGKQKETEKNWKNDIF